MKVDGILSVVNGRPIPLSTTASYCVHCHWCKNIIYNIPVYIIISVKWNVLIDLCNYKYKFLIAICCLIAVISALR